MGKGKLVGRSEATHLALDVARGIYPALTSIRKFGLNPAIAAAGTPVDIWEYGALQQVYVFPAWGTAPIDSLSSDNAGDTVPITIFGLDIDGNEVSQVITLQGQTRVALTTPLWRVYRMFNSDEDLVTGQGTDIAGTAYCYENTAITAGKPGDDSKVRASINDGNNQTQMAIYTIPKGFTGYLMNGQTGLQRGGQQVVAASMAFRVRLFGGAFRTAKTIGIQSTGSSNFLTDRAIYQEIPELSDVKVTCLECSQSDVAIFAELTILLEQNEEV